jgi:hypothetical protein
LLRLSTRVFTSSALRFPSFLRKTSREVLKKILL